MTELTIISPAQKTNEVRCDELSIGDWAVLTTQNYQGVLIVRDYNGMVQLLDPRNTWDKSLLADHTCIKVKKVNISYVL